MTFFTILFIIMLGGFLLMRLIPWLLAMKIRQMQKHGQNPQNPQNPQNRQKSNIKRTRKKRIDNNTGDYIDYEEIND
ncbi:MAG: hypothetical protein WC395_04135 [Bacteroidales bacterium]